MKNLSSYLIKLIQVFIPTLLGILVVWGLFTIQDFLHNQYSSPGKYVQIEGDLLFAIPLIVVALIFQVVLVLPIWHKFQTNQKFFNLTINQFLLWVCVLGGLIFGFLIWTPQFGISDLLISSLIGFFSTGMYCAVNLSALYKLPK